MVKVFYLNRFTRWAYSIERLRRPSSSSSIVVHTFEQRYLQDQSANFSQILSVASLGRGKCCIRFWGRSDQNCGYHGNRKLPPTYNGKKRCKCVFSVTFNRIFIKHAGIRNRHKISDDFELRLDRTFHYRVIRP